MATSAGSVRFESHLDEFKTAKTQQVLAWLEAVGIDAESTAANFAPVDTSRLKNSISHAVVQEEQAVYIGTNVEYAIYQELGTGIFAEGGSGRNTPWSYKDSHGEWHKTSGTAGKHFLKFGITAHAAEYEAMLERQLKG